LVEFGVATFEADMVIARTERLTLRRWQESDRKPFAGLNADSRVMEFMPGLLNETESNAFADRIEDHFHEHGFGLCAVEVSSTRSFIGFVGLSVPTFGAEFTPCVEIGWRLSADSWGQGFATEGAQAMVRHAFEVIGLESLVSFAVPANIRSRRVMEKLGMTHDPRDDFDYPKLPEGHALRRHVFYRLSRSQWDAQSTKLGYPS
jgi:RimJ/RimL family protein N-acetyltransferase